jgi:hypothetical protein
LYNFREVHGDLSVFSEGETKISYLGALAPGKLNLPSSLTGLNLTTLCGIEEVGVR